jgi:HAE1 family hydrophobic/amphiphilic exporter-1
MREVVRRDQRPQVTIRGDIRGQSVRSVWRSVREILEATEMPAGAAFIMGGEQEEIARSFRDMGWALILSVLLIYGILAAQFESFVDPLIMSAILPVGTIGGLFTLWVTGHSLNIMSIIGIVALLGIVVDNSIVKLAAVRQLRHEGMDGRAALMEASRIRLRPILMTSVTTVLGMIPMAIGIGTGDQMQRPLAVAILGGLSIGTVLTLFLTPVLYECIHQRIDPDYAKAPAGSSVESLPQEPVAGTPLGP